jgi:hypothetical protein
VTPCIEATTTLRQQLPGGSNYTEATMELPRPGRRPHSLSSQTLSSQQAHAAAHHSSQRHSAQRQSPSSHPTAGLDRWPSIHAAICCSIAVPSSEATPVCPHSPMIQNCLRFSVTALRTAHMGRFSGFGGSSMQRLTEDRGLRRPAAHACLVSYTLEYTAARKAIDRPDR